MPPSVPPGPLTENAAKIKIMQVEGLEHPPTIEVDEVTATPDPPITSEDPAS